MAKRQAQPTVPAALECSLCLELFNDPRNLPCGHTFCLKCLQQFTDKSRPNCSLCRKPWQIPDDGLCGLPKNYVAESFKDSVPSTKKCVLAADGRQHGPAEYFCVDCWDSLCNMCQECHRYTKVTRDHVLKPVRELSSDDISQHRKQTMAMCNLHKNQEIILYCTECKESSCTACFATKHSKHNCIDLEQADAGFTEVIQKALTDSKAAEKETKEEIIKLKAAQDNLKSYQTEMATLASSRLNDLNGQLDAAFEKIKQHISDIGEAALHSISKEMDEKFENEYDKSNEYVKKVKEQSVSCERLLSPAFSVVERARLVKEVTSVPLVGMKSALLLQNNQQYLTDSADMLNFKFSLTSNVTPPTLSMVANHNTREQGGNYFFIICALNNKILHGHQQLLCVFNETSQTVETRFTPPSGQLVDAVLMLDNNIVCSTSDNNVYILSHAGQVIKKTPITSPHGLHVNSNDGHVILAADNHIYESTLGGYMWSEVMQAPDDNMQLYYLVQVKTNKKANDDCKIFWVIESNSSSGQWRLSEYTVNTNMKKPQISRRDIDTTSTRITQNSRLAYDGYDSVMLSDYNCHAVHMYSVSEGQYKCQLGLNYVEYPIGISFNVSKYQLYVGLYNCYRVDAYQFTRPAKGRTTFNMQLTM